MRHLAVRVGAAAFALIGCAPAGAQTTALDAARPAFDVVSIKPTQSAAARNGLLQAGRFTQINVTLQDLIRFAYGVQQIAGGPGWIASDRFDIDARGRFDRTAYLPKPDGSPPAIALMLQRVLEDRFRVSVHVETRDAPAFALVRATKNQQLGPGLQRSDVDCAAVLAASAKAGAAAPRPQNSSQSPPKAPPCSMRIIGGEFFGHSVSMSQLADALSSVVDRPVVDHTNVSGVFDVHLTWMSELPAGDPDRPATTAVSADAPPVLVTAVREQLGLKLEPTKAPMKTLVVDRAAQPTPN